MEMKTEIQDEFRPNQLNRILIITPFAQTYYFIFLLLNYYYFDYHILDVTHSLTLQPIYACVC